MNRAWFLLTATAASWIVVATLALILVMTVGGA